MAWRELPSLASTPPLALGPRRDTGTTVAAPPAAAATLEAIARAKGIVPAGMRRVARQQPKTQLRQLPTATPASPREGTLGSTSTAQDWGLLPPSTTRWRLQLHPSQAAVVLRRNRWARTRTAFRRWPAAELGLRTVHAKAASARAVRCLEEPTTTPVAAAAPWRQGPDAALGRLPVPQAAASAPTSLRGSGSPRPPSSPLRSQERLQSPRPAAAHRTPACGTASAASAVPRETLPGVAVAPRQACGSPRYAAPPPASGS
mmetsp:Transcript_54457/g.151735  ORF Transcript_54457/g.151735 Transcript_54457/m.151735 type:complete len:260 (-) Transcript_54457:480-1259(-)